MATALPNAPNEPKQLDDQSQFAKIKSDFQEALSALSETHKEWIEYDNFYLAKHWSSERVSWRPDPVINYISYVVDQKAPQLTNNRPTGLILPTAEGDEEVAKLFTQVTDVISERADLENKLDEVVRTGLLLGVGWFKVYWDNSLSGGSPAKMNVWKGDVCIECPDPSNVYHDPQASRVEDCRYIIYATLKPVSQIKEIAEKQFGLKGIEIQAETSFQTEIYDRPSKNATNKDCAVFYEYWYKENGTINCIYAAGGKILKRMTNVYKHGRYPFVPFVPKKKRKSLVGIGEPKNLINNQKLLNKLVEMPTTNAMFTSQPMLLVKHNNGIDPGQVSAKPGRIYTVREVAGAMDWVEPPSMPPDIYKLIEMMKTDIEKIGGIYDAVTGETPTGITAASAIQLLQEQGSIPIKGIARNLYDTIKDVYEQMIGLVKEFYTEQRYLRITDNEGGYQFQPFVGAAYAEIDLDVKVSAGASTPTSKAYIAQLATDLFKNGVILPSEYVDMQEGLPNKDKIVQRLKEQESMQQQQQAMAEQGGDPNAILQHLSPEERQAFMKLPPEQQQQFLQQAQGGAA